MIKDQLHQISESFCPLRWTYMQVDLEHGKVKACCKTPFQKITENELRRLGKEAIFNGGYVQDRRREMLDGIKHEDCTTCWTEEERGLLSYRYLQSAQEPFRSGIDDIRERASLTSAVPRHLEIISNTLCDLKCCYCGPEFSSSWEHEVNRWGALPVISPSPPNLPGDPSFQKFFWEWFEDVKDSIEYVQFNGGEPLLQKEFFSFLALLLDSPKNNRLKIGVITNLNTPKRKLDALRELLPQLLEKHEFRFGISQDSVRAKAEYIRYGLKWSRFDENIRALLREFPKLKLQVAPTMSALNVTNIKDLLIYLAELSDEYSAEIILRPSIVMFPDFQSPLILTDSYSKYLESAVNFLEKRNLWPNMRDRLSEILCALQETRNTDSQRRKFFIWFSELDKRRGTDFVGTFPEMKNFWQRCSSF